MDTNRLSPTRRRLTAAALLAGPLVTLAGMATTPWESEQTTASYQDALAGHPTQAQIACLLLVFGYGLLGLANFTILRHAGGAPRGLKGVATVLAYFGATILPGMVMTDFYDLALATKLPDAQGVAVSDAAQGYGLAAIGMAPAVAGFTLGVILVGVTAWKARIAPAWVPALLLAAMVVGFLDGPLLIASAALMVIAYGAVAHRLLGGRRAAAPVAAPLAA